MEIKFENIDHLFIWLFIFIDDLCQQTELQFITVRLSNNHYTHFSDSELFTCAIFAELLGCKTKKDGYKYIKRHYLAWFPNLPVYEVYNRKLNKHVDAIAYIFKMINRTFNLSNERVAQIDTAPITVCQAQHSNKARAAKPLVSKGYCAAKKKYYVGVKLQVVAQNRKHKLPIPINFHIETAATHDLEIAKSTVPLMQIHNFSLFGDKAYKDESFQLDLFENNRIQLITPIKKLKGQKQLSYFQNLFNNSHSSKRQPIENLFGWINDKTNIEKADKIRSVNGLLCHISLKMVAALILLFIKF